MVNEMYKLADEIVQKKSIKTIVTDKLMNGLKIDARNERIFDVGKENLSKVFNSISGTDIGKVLAGDMKPINDKLNDMLVPVKASVVQEYKGIAYGTIAGIAGAGAIIGIIIGKYILK